MGSSLCLFARGGGEEGEAVEDGRTLRGVFSVRWSPVLELERSRGIPSAERVSALSPAPSAGFGRVDANPVVGRGQSREGAEGPSGLRFRERESVQQGGGERMEIAGAGEFERKSKPCPSRTFLLR